VLMLSPNFQTLAVNFIRTPQRHLQKDGTQRKQGLFRATQLSGAAG
jgi:hypothetical protein